MFLFTLNSLSHDYSNIYQALSSDTKTQKFTHETDLETIWTLVPVFIILCIAVPSFVLLYAVDVMVDSSVTVKVIGKQWYWNYELEFPFLDSENLKIGFKRRIFDSYLLESGDLIKGQLRNLEVSQPLIFPLKTHIDVIVTADDVLHSFAIPSAGFKLDAVPGRLNHMGAFFERPGVLYGQCSELCGANHAFMPIKALVVPYDIYVSINNQ